jgi:glycosyltransferase involved in cell wall biosynthesis
VNVLQVVTLVTPDGAYGGPLRVAFNQAREIREHGHCVTIVGACRGYSEPPETVDDTAVHLSKARRVIPFIGISGISSPAAIMWIFRHRRQIDVVHVHLGRDLVTMPAAMLALLLKKRLVIQTHGMISKSDKAVAPLLDRVLTRPVLRRADVVLYLSSREREEIMEIESAIDGVHLPNGVPETEETADPRDGLLDVLFLARLHERKRPTLFVEAAAELLAEGNAARFSMVGPDGGEAAHVCGAINRLGDYSSAIVWEGPLAPDETGERMVRASIYVLPSIDEPFPMSVLEAMAVGLPVVVTESCGLADVVRQSGSGIVVDHSKQSLVDAMRTLLDDPGLRVEMGTAARKTAREQFSMQAVGDALVAIYSLQADRQHS